MQMADGLGIPKENRWISVSPTMKDLKTTYMQIMKKCRALSASNIPHVLFVYLGGHGATQAEKQVYLLNSEKP